MSQFIVTNIARKNNYLGFFKFYQPKATGVFFLSFEWTLINTVNNLFGKKQMSGHRRQGINSTAFDSLLMMSNLYKKK
jgi:hypothetical protein